MIIYETHNELDNLVDSIIESSQEVSDYKDPILQAKSVCENMFIVCRDNKYYIDSNDITSYMESAEVDSVAEALNNIIEANSDCDIDATNVCVVIGENDAYIVDDLLNIGCVFEVSSKWHDIPVVGEKTARKAITWVKSKVAGIKGGKEASVAEYNKEINKLKKSVERLNQDIEKAEKSDSITDDKLRMAGKAIIKYAVIAAPSAFLAATGQVIAADALAKTLGGSGIGAGLKLLSATVGTAGGVVSGGVSGGMFELIKDYRSALQYMKKYYEQTIKELESKRDKLAASEEK